MTKPSVEMGEAKEKMPLRVLYDSDEDVPAKCEAQLADFMGPN